MARRVCDHYDCRRTCQRSGVHRPLSTASPEGVYPVFHERGKVRHPLPSLAYPLVTMVLGILSVLFNTPQILLGDKPLSSALFALVGVLSVAYGVATYKTRIIERDRVRDQNFWRVLDHQINQPMPAPSAELARIEADIANRYRQQMAKLGKDTEGRQLPDPNSNRSRKKAARKERREAARALKRIYPTTLAEHANVGRPSSRPRSGHRLRADQELFPD